MEEMKEYDLVWLLEERCFAEIISLGAFFSTVKYSRDGIDYEVLVGNDEFKHIEGEEDHFDDSEN